MNGSHRDESGPFGAGSAQELADLARRAGRAGANGPLPLREWVALAEAWRIAQALSEARGNRSAAARALGIGRRTLYSKIEKLGLVPSWNVGRAQAATGTDAPGVLAASSRPEDA